MKKITSKKQFKASMTTIDTLLDKATRQGGFHTLTKEESGMLADLSKQVEEYEDNTLHLMPINLPIKPKSIKEAIEYKRVQLNLTQAGLAKTLGMGAPKLSQILSGKRPPDVYFILALYNELEIDPEFILEHAGNVNGMISSSHGTEKGNLHGRRFRTHKPEISGREMVGVKASRKKTAKKQHA